MNKEISLNGASPPKLPIAVVLTRLKMKFLALKILILKVSSISYLRTRLKQMFAERMNAQKLRASPILNLTS
jgi:hypothetical protein